MKNRTPTAPNGGEPLPAFDPVPRRKPRHDGWTPPRQRAFIEALADSGSVTRAAASVNMSTESAYALRRQPGAESFRRAWDAALDFGVARLKDIALERAIEGDLVPVIAGGKLHGYRRVRNDRLLMFAIRMNDRAPSSNGGGDGRRRSADHFQPRDARSPAATITHPTLTDAEAQDAAAARLADFSPVPLSPLQQAEIYDALAAEARRQADLLPAQDPAEPFLRPEDLEDAGLGPAASPHADDEAPELPPGERPWYRLHDEAGARAIEEAVASIEAAKVARLLAAPECGSSAEASAKAEGGSEPDADSPAQAPTPTPELPLSPKTSKPKRAYKKRTPKPPFVASDDRSAS